MTVQRVEKQIIKPTNEYYSMLDEFCYLSKNLYNHANYLVRQEFTQNDKWLRYGEMDKLLKTDLDFPDYKAMPTAQSAQQVLRLLEKDWKSFFTAIKDWSKNKNKYLGRPKLPKYVNKNGRKILIMTAQNCKISDNGIIRFPKTFNGFTAKCKAFEKPNFEKLNQIRFLPRQSKIVMEIVYSIKVTDNKIDSNNYISIDIGVDNLATITNNFCKQPIIINGKPLKSVNQFYNKQVSHYRKIAKRVNDLDYTHRMNRLTDKRNAKIDDYLHKASRQVVNYCKTYNVSKIIIGNNKGWKQNSKLSKRVNQHFVQIPYMRFIEMLQYKAEELGIEIILTEESYTSGTSFVDGETPSKSNYNKSRRIQRGLFRVNDGGFINADVNGSFQIMKKVIPNEEILWDRGCAYQPIVVTVE